MWTTTVFRGVVRQRCEVENRHPLRAVCQKTLVFFCLSGHSLYVICAKLVELQLDSRSNTHRRGSKKCYACDVFTALTLFRTVRAVVIEGDSGRFWEDLVKTYSDKLLQRSSWIFVSGRIFFRVFSGFPSVDPADCSSAHGWKSSRRLRAR